MTRIPAIALLIPIAACAASETPPRPAGFGTVTVRVIGFENDQGQALMSLFVTAPGFPGDPDSAHAAVVETIHDGRVEHTFEMVPAGPFAIAVFHDADVDFELDTGLFGIPVERWGVSRGAAGFMGPPSFESAQLELEDGATMTIELEIG